MTGSDGVLHRIFEKLGALEANVENVKGKVDVEARVQAQHRESMRQVMAAQTEAVRTLTQQEEVWRRDWDEEWRPLLEDYRTRRDEAAGRSKLGKALLAFWVAIAAFAGALLNRLLEHWR